MLAGAAALAGLVFVALRVSRPVVVTARPPALSLAPQASGSSITPEIESRIFVVIEATGRVEAQRGGQWVLISPGDVLTQADVVRTGSGRAILRLGAKTEIELRDRVEIRLDSISRAGASLDLRHGKVVAHVARPGDHVAITAARTKTENVDAAAPARFVVTADDRGHVAVATTLGTARFESAGRAVDVTAGTSTQAEPGHPPDEPEKIAEDVFLSVVWPVGERREDKVPIAGRVEPGSVVRINGTPADTDAAGRFATSVPVRKGSNPVEVEVEDIAGRLKRENREIRKVSTKAPELAPVPAQLWQK